LHGDEQRCQGCLLLAAAGSIFFVLLAALLSGILIPIHHIHIVMYVPTIAVIVLLRHHLIEGAARGCIVLEVSARNGSRPEDGCRGRRAEIASCTFSPARYLRPCGRDSPRILY
jgi:hypothetical protein